MYLNRNFQHLESNCCPDCAQPYLKFGIGYDRGINCTNCGYTVPIGKYQEVMKNYFKRMNKLESEESL